ncbi:Nuclear pore complex p54 component scnup57 [Operophtera brumata]|uniref:Nuclear pore complex p54 component scnup57 n=1 Tax=Operophtera brumata TaxID=104452 RepID=A0A0L7KS20_OPEBR|nr:Nuclear pore complex p54 component scnup57 [Operophtera brumata]
MSFTFGSNTVSQTSAFGATPAKPSFSFGGANTSTTPSAGFGFGTTTSTGFGTANTTGFGGFGATAAPAGFGAGFGTNTFGTGTGFGASTAPFGTSAPAFGTTAPAFGTTAPAFGTTAPAFGTTAPAFGTTAPAFGTTAPAFGTNTLGGATSFGTSNFGAGSTLGGAFGAKPAATGFGGFGAGLGQTNQFGQPQQQQQQQQQQPQGPANATEALVAAVYNCCVFGDERDTVLAKWNLLQAQWGTGMLYRNAPALELNEQNPLCRFKAVGYSKLSRKEETHGHVIIYVVDKNAGNSHVAAGELSNFLNGGAARTALGGAGCIAVTPCGAPAQNALQHYLSTPPPGFSETEQARLQAEFLKRTDEELGELRTRRAASAARLTQLSARLHRLRHTLLQVMVGRHEVMGRVGAALAPEEEVAQARIRELASQLSAPPLYNVSTQ